ncbi:MAG: mechanosensitive ion channel family protein [Acidobacteria bacterium]|nr:mechanosensitive ion channel family protein [Acidobacteriota bacterium]
MHFWTNLQAAAGMAGLYHWVAICFMLTAAMLFALVPSERMRIRNAALLFAVAFVGLLIAALLSTYGAATTGAPYRWTRWASLFVSSVAIVNLASVLVFDVLLDAIKLKPPRIMRDLLLAFSYIIIALSLLSQSGVDLTGIVATSAVITAVVGFSLQDTLGNIMGGMALQMERTIGVGDWVRIDTQEGRVKEIRWRQTSIETRNWDTIVIPNSVLMKGQVTILGRRAGEARQHRMWVYFNVDFRFAPPDVIDAVEAALRAEPIPNVAREPAPNCIFMDFKESYGHYAVRYWLTDMAVDDPTSSVVRQRIYFALRRAAIPLSIPAHSLFITEDDETRRERKHRQEIDTRVEALKEVELFHPLTDDERREIAERLVAAPFVRGEAMTRQGAQAHWLYIITSGEAEVRVAAEGSKLSEKVATLRAGNFFGEMGLMTGEPRTATVIATTDVECYRLDKEAFHDILRRRPEIAEDISHILARRRVELDGIREGLNEEAMRRRMRHTQHDFLDRIRNFFKLDKQHSGSVR